MVLETGETIELFFEFLDKVMFSNMKIYILVQARMVGLYYNESCNSIYKL